MLYETTSPSNGQSLFFSVPVDTVRDLYRRKDLTSIGVGLASLQTGLFYICAAFFAAYCWYVIVACVLLALGLLLIAVAIFAFIVKGRLASSAQGIFLAAIGTWEFILLMLWVILYFGDILDSPYSIDILVLMAILAALVAWQLGIAVLNFRRENKILALGKCLKQCDPEWTGPLKAELKSLWRAKCKRPDVMPVVVRGPLATAVKRILIGKNRLLILPMDGWRVNEVDLSSWVPILGNAIAGDAKRTNVELPIDGLIRECRFRTEDLKRLQEWARTLPPVENQPPVI